MNMKTLEQIKEDILYIEAYEEDFYNDVTAAFGDYQIIVSSPIGDVNFSEVVIEETDDYITVWRYGKCKVFKAYINYREAEEIKFAVSRTFDNDAWCYWFKVTAIL